MPPLKVEAGDRALETARKIHAKCYMWARAFAHNITGSEQIAEVAALIQSAMNAQDEATETRWQNAIYELCKKMVGPKNEHLIDGGGCDSGDALDFTLAEIGQAIGFWQIVADAMNAQEREWREALKRIAEKNPDDPDVESWKWLARWMKEEIQRLLAERGEGR